MKRWFKMCRGWVMLLAALAVVLPSATSHAFVLHVLDQNGNPVTGFRWLLEEDNTYPVAPYVHDTGSLGVGIYKSHASVVAAGTDADLSPLANPDVVDPAKRYVLSVLPNQGHSLGAAHVAAGQGEVIAYVNAHPLPPAQITVLVFRDNQPINSAPDIPAEPGLSGFRVELYDDAGQVTTDVFGQPLGTTYYPNGSVKEVGSGLFTEDWSKNNPFGRTPDSLKHGRLTVKNIAPGKYGVKAAPIGPVKDFEGKVFAVPNISWIQTSTIEGKPTNDAWVKAGEPNYFNEGGFFDMHVFLGFTLPQPMTKPSPTAVYATIVGQAVSAHQARPPQQPGLAPALPVRHAMIGLNDLGNVDEQVYVQPAADDGTFVIEHVPPGLYQLVVWDQFLDMIIDFRTVNVPPSGGLIDLGQVVYYQWFSHLVGHVFMDANHNGFRDPGEQGMDQQGLNLRFRDGSIYQTAMTNAVGEYRFDEVFPFMKWLIAEVNYDRFAATGMTAIVDNGGPVAPGASYVPQPQFDELGPIMNPNTVPMNNLSRTETGSMVLLEAMIGYADQTNVIDWGKAPYGSGQNGGITGVAVYSTTRAENDPRFAAAEDWEPGIPRVRVNLFKVIGDLDSDGRPVDALMVASVTTDSWDDSLPTGCKWLGLDLGAGENALYQDCAEIISNWNQVRPGVFDGGYAFTSYYPSGIQTEIDPATGKEHPVLDANGEPQPNEPGEALVESLPTGLWVVQVEVPPGYELVKEEDKNVDFGDEFAVVPEILPPPCVGEDHFVPEELSLFPGVESYYRNKWRPLCDAKLIEMVEGENPAADFALFTEVPKAGRLVVLVTDDINNDPAVDSPRRGDKMAVSWLPISVKDFAGREVARGYTDEWGTVDLLVQSTYTINAPTPSGVSPGVVTVCLNDMGDPLNPDPYWNPSYTRFCMNWEVWPGKTTIIDAPVIPIAAMTASHGALDCSIPAAFPEIDQVDGLGGGPWVDPQNGPAPVAITGSGFGGSQGNGRVELVWATGSMNLPVTSWTDTGISALVPWGVETGQLTVVTDAGHPSVVGITLHVRSSSYNPPIVRVPAGASLQAALDAAQPGTLVLIEPGVHAANLILSKPLELQGYGARTTVLEAGLYWNPDVEAAWVAKLDALVTSGAITLIPGTHPELYSERGAGLTVFAAQSGKNAFDPKKRRALVDGVTFLGALHAGGVFVNAYARGFEVSNNVFVNNAGNFGGGLRVGTRSVVNDTSTGYRSSFNTDMRIHHNHFKYNGGIDGGGAISLFNGADGYKVYANYICGNFSYEYGGGISHFGLSPGGTIERNVIAFNEAFDEGGGIIVAGELPLRDGSVLTPGSGSVAIDRNLIQGNLGNDDGGGIRTLLTNGQDVQAAPRRPDRWHQVAITNNMIVNNVSTDQGGGVSLDDSARVLLIHNTIGHNDSTGTSIDSFGVPCATCPPGGYTGGLTSTFPQPAGIASGVHSAGLQAAFGNGFQQSYSDPLLWNNILWHNRAFHWNADANGGLGALEPAAATPLYWDLGVVGVPGALHPRYGVLTSLVGPDGASYEASNQTGEPPFVAPYLNTYQATASGTGYFVTIVFNELTLSGDYHVDQGLPGANETYPATVDAATAARLLRDYDADARPANADVGADELVGVP